VTYFNFLGIFVGIPLLILSVLNWWDHRQGRALPDALRSWSPTVVITAHVIVAVLYTTPWDNYLVATRVWWYDPELVTGIVLGWVPIEEYTFFVLQTLLTALWLLWLARRIKPTGEFVPNIRFIKYATAITVLIWLAATILLFSGWRPGTYLALESAWALLPVIIQVLFGADILLYNRHLIAWSLFPPTLYLAATDAIAIAAGTWTIDPQQSTNIFVPFIELPIEELLFFFLTNLLVVFGVTLVLSNVSHQRLEEWKSTRVKAKG